MIGLAGPQLALLCAIVALAGCPAACARRRRRRLQPEARREPVCPQPRQLARVVRPQRLGLGAHALAPQPGGRPRRQEADDHVPRDRGQPARPVQLEGAVDQHRHDRRLARHREVQRPLLEREQLGDEVARALGGEEDGELLVGHPRGRAVHHLARAAARAAVDQEEAEQVKCNTNHRVVERLALDRRHAGWRHDGGDEVGVDQRAVVERHHLHRVGEEVLGPLRLVGDAGEPQHVLAPEAQEPRREPAREPAQGDERDDRRAGREDEGEGPARHDLPQPAQAHLPFLPHRLLRRAVGAVQAPVLLHLVGVGAALPVLVEGLEPEVHQLRLRRPGAGLLEEGRLLGLAVLALDELRLLAFAAALGRPAELAEHQQPARVALLHGGELLLGEGERVLQLLAAPHAVGVHVEEVDLGRHREARCGAPKAVVVRRGDRRPRARAHLAQRAEQHLGAAAVVRPVDLGLVPHDDRAHQLRIFVGDLHAPLELGAVGGDARWERVSGARLLALGRRVLGRDPAAEHHHQRQLLLADDLQHQRGGGAGVVHPQEVPPPREELEVLGELRSRGLRAGWALAVAVHAVGDPVADPAAVQPGGERAQRRGSACSRVGSGRRGGARPEQV